MTFKGKEVHVKIVGDAKDAYRELNKVVEDEVSRGITGSFNQTLFNAINQKIELLKQNPQFGIHVTKDRIPRDYIIDYEVNNIWKIDLPSSWRLIYTLKGTEVEILTIILDIFSHKDYDKKFGYRKKN